LSLESMVSRWGDVFVVTDMGCAKRYKFAWGNT
jgi:hypothetical protein